MSNMGFNSCCGYLLGAIAVVSLLASGCDGEAVDDETAEAVESTKVAGDGAGAAAEVEGRRKRREERPGRL